VPASAFVIAITLVAAFSGRVQGLIRICYRAFRACVDHVKKQLVRLEKQASTKSPEERRQIEELGKQHTQQKRDRGYDFWGKVLTERETKYEIPEVNRKRATRKRLAAGRGGTWSRLLGDDYR
jgi:hypothetical protein